MALGAVGGVFVGGGLGVTLTDAPGAFGTTFEQAASWPSEVWRSQLTGLAAFVAVVGDADVGLVRGRPLRVPTPLLAR